MTDVERSLAVDQRHGVPLDVHADDPLGSALCVAGRLRELDAAGLAPPPDRDLGLHGHGPELGAGRRRFLRRAGDAAWRDRDAERRQDFLRLIFEQLHRREG